MLYSASSCLSFSGPRSSRTVAGEATTSARTRFLVRAACQRGPRSQGRQPPLRASAHSPGTRLPTSDSPRRCLPPAELPALIFARRSSVISSHRTGACHPLPRFWQGPGSPSPQLATHAHGVEINRTHFTPDLGEWNDPSRSDPQFAEHRASHVQ